MKIFKFFLNLFFIWQERMEAVKAGLMEENGGLRGEMARLKAELDSQVGWSRNYESL
jgi:hypothetical protein